MKHLKTFEKNDGASYEKMVNIKIKGEINIPFEDIEDTEEYKDAINRNDEHALYYGVVGYINENPDIVNYEYDLVDGNGEPIDDEEEFDEKAKLYNTGKKYNL